jgi:integrase
VRVGRRTFTVREFSTGCTNKSDAEAVGAAEEARIRAEYLDTGKVMEPVRQVTIHDCIVAYRSRPARLHPFDVQRLTELDTAMGHVIVSGVREAWGAWLRDRGRNLAPSTVARWRSTLMAAMTYGADEFGIAVPILRAVRDSDAERIAYLTPQQETRLLAAYSQWAAPVMLVLCETGLRTQEALRLDWRQVDWQRRALVIEHAGRRGGPRTKSGKSRRIGMRPIVCETLGSIWEKQGCPDTGTVFLNRRGQPYADTRQVGGNPLTKAHRTACQKAGITGFRIHDWRHHFAVWFLKRGGNSRALCQIAGWSSMRMVQRYAVFEQSDLDEVMALTARTVRPRIGQNADPGRRARRNPQVPAAVPPGD